MAKGSIGVPTSTIIRLQKPEWVKCDCTKCINWAGRKKGCRLSLESKIKDGKCRRFGTHVTTGYTLTKEEKAAIKEHNKAIDLARSVPHETPVVKLSAIQKACGSSYITLDYLRKLKTRFRPGNARYEIECINDSPLTIKMKGMKGSRKTYIVEE